MAYPNTSTAAREDRKGCLCVLTYESLDVDAIVRSVRNDSAGAIATFIGTTRNSFKGKTVTRLEYQAYSKLAIKTMAQIVEDAREAVIQPPHDASSIACVVYHRLGTVPVGEASIVIAVSSPHRKEAFATCERILEDVKEKAQIWKREYYEGMEEAEWMENRT